MTRRFCFLTVGLLALVAAGCGNTGTYLDCVARGGAASQDKGDEQKRACMKKYQQKLPKAVVENIKGESSFYENLKLVSGTIHNRSQEWLITEITVALHPDGQFGEKHTFRAEVEAEPLASSRFSINIYAGITRSANYGWGIEEAYGIPAR